MKTPFTLSNFARQGKTKNKKRNSKPLHNNISLYTNNLIIDIAPYNTQKCYITVKCNDIVILSGITDIKYLNDPNIFYQKVKAALPEFFNNKGGHK
ncbi:hypothetical protein [Pedobacter glucosidilyticus]|uniref:hypothetical protein n=1 Tax=Pedobacter glucosidilyticus TaxID=1122941 RepID=UPI0004787F4F